MKTHGYLWKTRLLPKQGEICFHGKSVWGKMLSHLLASSNVAHALSDQPRVKVLCNAREGKFYLSTTTEKRMQQSTKETCNGKAAMPPPKPTHTVFATASWALPAGMSVSEGLKLNAKMREALGMSPSSTGP